MEAELLLNRLKDLGFEQYAKLNKCDLHSAHYPENPKSIEWIFAFPRAKAALNWLTENLSQQNTLSLSEYEMSPISDDKDIEDIEELLSPESPQTDFLDLSPQSELEKVRLAQESTIASLEAELASLSDPPYSKCFAQWQSSLNEKLKELNSSLKTYLNSLSSPSSLLSLESIQEYSSLDEELTEKITKYSKMIEEGIQNLDISPHHLCLVSEHAQEYTELCGERRRLQELHTTQIQQNALSEIAYAKYDSAMKKLEEILLRELQDKYLKANDLETAIGKLKTQLDQLDTKYEERNRVFEDLLEQVSQNYATLESLEEFTLLSNKKREYETTKMQEVMNFLNSQKTNSVLGLAGILLEQDAIQGKYNKIHRFSSFLEELASQLNFRLELYPKLIKKQKLALSSNRQTVDPRDAFLSTLGAVFVAQDPVSLSLSELSTEIANASVQFRNSAKSHKAVIESTINSTKGNILALSKTLGNYRNDSLSHEYRQLLSQLTCSLSKLEETLQLISLEINKNKRNFLSISGLSERDFFIEFFLSPAPSFLA